MKRTPHYFNPKRVAACLGLLSITNLTQAQQRAADQGDIQKTETQAAASKTFYEVNGVVSMEAENASYMNKWTRVGTAMVGDSLGTWKGGVLRFDINFKKPGKYALWILAKKGRNGQYSGNDIKIWLDRDLSQTQNPTIANRATDKIDGLIDAAGVQTSGKPGNDKDKRESELNIGPHHSFIWLSNPKDGKGPAYWHVKTPGKHHIEFVMGEEYGYALDKVVLTLNNEKPPQGRGPAETASADAKPFRTGLDKDVVLPPQWAFGVLYGGYTNQKETLERTQQIIEHDYPIDAYWIDSWFWDYQGGGKGPGGFLNFKGDTVAYPAAGQLWGQLGQQHIKAGIWIWNTILKDGNEKTFADWEQKGYFKSVYPNKSTWHNKGAKSLTGDINFDSPAALGYFQQQMKHLFDKGLDFYKLDRDAGLSFAKGTFETTQKLGKETKGRGFILQHMGDLADPAFKRYPTKWSGDSEIAWTLPDFPNPAKSTNGGFTENIEMTANPRRLQYEIPFLTNDAGGFRSVDSKDIGEEIFIRWMQFAAFNPVMEVFTSLYNPSSNLGWKVSPKADAVFRDLTHLRMRLFPYIYSYAHRTRQTGEKMIQGDGEHKYQYLFGKELLVAPVNQKGATSKEIYLPAGTWIDYWNGKTYQGNQTLNYATTLEQVPMFVRAGAIIPMREYARAIELGNNQLLTLDIYPAGKSEFTLFEDDGISNDYLTTGFATTRFSSAVANGTITLFIDPIKGNYTGKLNQRNYVLQVHQPTAPAGVQVQGKLLKKSTDAAFKTTTQGWYYDAAKKVTLVKISSATNQGAKVVLQQAGKK